MNATRSIRPGNLRKGMTLACGCEYRYFPVEIGEHVVRCTVCHRDTIGNVHPSRRDPHGWLWITTSSADLKESA